MTSILKVFLKQYKSPTGPNKFSRGISPIKADQRGPKVELNLNHVDTDSSKKTKSLSQKKSENLILANQEKYVKRDKS